MEFRGPKALLNLHGSRQIGNLAGGSVGDSLLREAFAQVDRFRFARDSGVTVTSLQAIYN
jgi:hypothetical protein